MTAALGVMGGSGLYGLAGLEQVEQHVVETPFGPPSGPLTTGMLGATRLIFLPRHGLGHRIPPRAVNFRANIHALKQAGVEQIVSVSAVGSLQESLPPGDLVLVDQFVDRCVHRNASFFDQVGAVAHVSLAEPTDAALREALARAAKDAGLRAHPRGTYLCMDGPHFSTRAESEHYRASGFDVIGMTNATEAKLAREAELPYASACFVTDYDCWRPSEEAVSADAVMQQLARNADAGQALLRALVPHLPEPRESPASRALDDALITDPATLDAATAARLQLLLLRVTEARASG